MSLVAAAVRAEGDPAPVATSQATVASDTAPIFTAAASKPTAAPESGRIDAPRIQAPELANAVASGLPKFESNKASAADLHAAMLQDTDMPRNHVVRLPRYVVHDNQVPESLRRIPLTPRERADLAMKQYVIDTKDMPGWAAVVFRALFQAYASQEYADAERAQLMADLDFDEREAALTGDKAGSESLKAEATDLFMRHGDWAAPVPSFRPNASPR
jgi:hypothetical protein